MARSSTRICTVLLLPRHARLMLTRRAAQRAIARPLKALRSRGAAPCSILDCLPIGRRAENSETLPEARQRHSVTAVCCAGTILLCERKTTPCFAIPGLGSSANPGSIRVCATTAVFPRVNARLRALVPQTRVGTIRATLRAPSGDTPAHVREQHRRGHSDSTTGEKRNGPGLRRQLGLPCQFRRLVSRLLPRIAHGHIHFHCTQPPSRLATSVSRGSPSRSSTAIPP